MGIVIDEVFTEIVGPSAPARRQDVVSNVAADTAPQSRKIMQELKRQEWRARRLSAD